MTSMRRQASQWICSILIWAVPEQRKMWARAVRGEVDAIPDNGAAFLFALNAVRGIALYLLVSRLSAAAKIGGMPLNSSLTSISCLANHQVWNTKLKVVGITCAISSAFLGITYLSIAGAPIQLIAINAAALIIGLIILFVWKQAPDVHPRQGDITLVLLSLALLATALAGATAEGITRWVAIGNLSLQPSLIILPMMILMFARDRGAVSSIAMSCAALALAMQPDRAMAGVLMLSLAALAITRADRFVMAALAASVGAFAVTMVSPDPLSAVPYVDQILFTAFDIHVFAGSTVVAGAALLLVPALYGLRYGPGRRQTFAVFGIVWFSIISAAILGNYPTPVVGYGGSAILGYLLSLGALFRSAAYHDASILAVPSRPAPGAQDPHSPFAQGQPA